MSTVIRCSPAKRKAPRASAGPERQESPTTSQRIVSRAYPVNSSLRTWRHVSEILNSALAQLLPDARKMEDRQ